MATQTFDKKKVLNAANEAVSELLTVISSLNEDKVNTVPYPGSWTAGQLCRHVSKSIGGMAEVMTMKAPPAERDPGERIPELKKIFLDFELKMTSPENVAPENGPYEKQAMIKEMTNAFERYKESSAEANPEEIINGTPLGPITKWELSYFILYHTQRHLHQMKKISEALQKN